MHNMTVLPYLFNYHSCETPSDNEEQYITEKLIKGNYPKYDCMHFPSLINCLINNSDRQIGSTSAPIDDVNDPSKRPWHKPIMCNVKRMTTCRLS